MPQGSRILIVEDEMIISMEIKQKLLGMGYIVTGQAITGEAAIQKAGDTKPDLVLMDIRLKGNMDGIAAAKRIIELYDLPIIFLTAHSDKSTLERAVAVSPSGYLLKPFKERELLTNIEMSLHKHRVKQNLNKEIVPDNKLSLYKEISSLALAIIVTAPDGKIEVVNTEATKLSGFSHAELVGKPLTVLFGGHQEMSKEAQESSSSSQLIFPDQIMLKHKNGSTIPVSLTAGLVMPDDQHMFHYMIILNTTDFSEIGLAAPSPQLIKQIMSLTSIIKFPSFVIDKAFKLIGFNSLFTEYANEVGISQYMLERPLYETPKFAFFGDMQDMQEIFTSGLNEKKVRRQVVDDNVRFIQYSYIPLKNRGEISHILTIMEDVTAQNQAIYDMEKIKKAFVNIYTEFNEIISLNGELRVPVHRMAHAILSGTTNDPTIKKMAQDAMNVMVKIDAAWINVAQYKDMTLIKDKKQ